MSTLKETQKRATEARDSNQKAMKKATDRSNSEDAAKAADKDTVTYSYNDEDQLKTR